MRGVRTRTYLGATNRGFCFTPHPLNIQEHKGTMSVSEFDRLLFRVAKIQLSSLCDGDKSLEPLPPTLLPMVDAKVMVGPAFCITVDDDHLATYQAVALAPPG